MIFVIAILFLLGFILTGVSIFQQRGILNKLEKEKRARGMLLAQNIAAASVANVLRGDREALQDSLETLHRKEELDYLFILDAKGHVLAKSGTREMPFYHAQAVEAQENFFNCFTIGEERFCEFISPIFSREQDRPLLPLEQAQASDKGQIRKVGVAVIGVSFATIDSQLNILVKKSSFLMFVMVLVCALATFYFFTQIVTRPLDKLIRVARVAAEEGDLTETLKEKSSDEMGVFIGTFNTLIVSLHKVVTEVRHVSDRVSALAEGLSSRAEEVNAATQEVSSAIHEISKVITTQARRTEETSQIMKEKMVESVKQVAINAKEGANASEETTSLAKEGMEQSRWAVEKTSHITGVASDVAQLVEALRTRSEEIGRIVEVITTIADQTNLLALNAAIEAARAGEAGRGFAVVAEEVRKLADSSAQAAEQIGGLVRGIQQQTSRVVDSVVSISHEVGDGEILIDKVRTSLERILKAAERTAHQVNQITIAAEHQFTSTQQVDHITSEVAIASEESASSVEEIFSSMEATSSTMEEMTATAQELANMASYLQELVRQFKI